MAMSFEKKRYSLFADFDVDAFRTTPEIQIVHGIGLSRQGKELSRGSYSNVIGKGTRSLFQIRNEEDHPVAANLLVVVAVFLPEEGAIFLISPVANAYLICGTQAFIQSFKAAGEIVFHCREECILRHL